MKAADETKATQTVDSWADLELSADELRRQTTASTRRVQHRAQQSLTVMETAF